MGVLNLVALRDELRSANLYEVERPRCPRPAAADLPMFRTYDGSGNDRTDLEMGRSGTRLGRNSPLTLAAASAHRELLVPNPREVSRRLLTRDAFQPATTLNVLAAAWIQFQVHDWFSHGDSLLDSHIEIPLDAADPWPEHPMRVRRTRPDPTQNAGDDLPPTHINWASHWWDGSQIYGSNEERNRMLREGAGGRLLVIDGRLPEHPQFSGLDLSGFDDNYWVGLALLHTLFVKEHNAICERLAQAYPSWDDEQLFRTARLVNCALMAKIHTVEWTPGILDHPVLHRAMNTNWYGLLGKWARRHVGRVGSGEILSGIPGSKTDHHSAPYSITEEFVTCYRLHPLIPDDYEIRTAGSGALIDTIDFEPLHGRSTRDTVDRYGMANLLYSFGVANPGAVTLHNHPRALQNHVRIDGHRLDLGTIDITRDRERGIPRYNDFREMLHRPRLESFEDLSANPRWVAELREVYAGDIDAVDPMVGMYAETPPPGFGFSDTAFRIFILMASRRLKSDRFFTQDYRADVYTPEGLDWIDQTTMADVLVRHHPELASPLAGVRNAFAPWQRGRSDNGGAR
ncbi:peroxidase family protein [Nocardia sp. XZ_19_385]